MEDIALTLQARNSAAFWTATARSRGHQVVSRPGFLAAVGDDRAGLRILFQSAEPTAADLAEATDLARRATGPVFAEDPFSATDLSHLGLRSWQMPIMLRQPAPPPTTASPIEVVHVEHPEQLRLAERIAIDSFEQNHFLPYREGELFPELLTAQTGVNLFVAFDQGEPAGVCVSVTDDGLTSFYWVGTLDAHRSRGVGRALMTAGIARAGELPMTLTASRLGRPLYESLGFTATGLSTWWS